MRRFGNGHAVRFRASKEARALKKTSRSKMNSFVSGRGKHSTHGPRSWTPAPLARSPNLIGFRCSLLRYYLGNFSQFVLQSGSFPIAILLPSSGEDSVTIYVQPRPRNENFQLRFEMSKWRLRGCIVFHSNSDRYSCQRAHTELNVRDAQRDSRSFETVSRRDVLF